MVVTKFDIMVDTFIIGSEGTFVKREHRIWKWYNSYGSKMTYAS